MIITFLEFFFIILNEKVLDKVSIVFPDLEIIINKKDLIFSFILKLIKFFSLRLLKN